MVMLSDGSRKMLIDKERQQEQEEGGKCEKEKRLLNIDYYALVSFVCTLSSACLMPTIYLLPPSSLPPSPTAATAPSYSPHQRTPLLLHIHHCVH